jgi:hypothetical protein
MPRTGLEPAREDKSHYHLKVACLPIPPPRLLTYRFYQTYTGNSMKNDRGEEDSRGKTNEKLLGESGFQEAFSFIFFFLLTSPLILIHV